MSTKKDAPSSSSLSTIPADPPKYDPSCSSSVTLSSEDLDDGPLPPLVRKQGIGAFMILINFVKGMVGPGCLSLPLAFKQAGLWTGFALVIIYGFLNNYCMLQLVHCSQYLSRKRGDAHLDYGNVASEAFGSSFRSVRIHKNKAKMTVNTAIIFLQIGICSVFYLFVGVHTKELIEQYFEFRASTTMFLIMILPAMILINFLRTLRIIAIFSAVGNVLMVVSLVFIYQHLIRSDHQFSKLPAMTDFDGIMTATGAILYSFEGQAMVLPMENRLKHPEKMVGPFGVLSSGMAFVTFVYTSCGFLGYITYGDGVQGSITLNLPDHPMFTVVKVLLTLVVFLGFVIQQYVIMEMTWPTIKSKVIAPKFPKSSPIPFELAYRSGLVLIAMLIAIGIPNLENIIPLVGVTAGMMLAFVFPATLDSITFLPPMVRRLPRLEGSEKTAQKLRIGWRILQNSALIAIGIFGCIAGLQSTIRALVTTDTS
uniref:Aa_trans domain-containing protein n=1 Tax=Panagrellus redivivus TaxID=6233 RepID=A0A7E4VUP0_PANRE